MQKKLLCRSWALLVIVFHLKKINFCFKYNCRTSITWVATYSTICQNWLKFTLKVVLVERFVLYVKLTHQRRGYTLSWIVCGYFSKLPGLCLIKLPPFLPFSHSCPHSWFLFCISFKQQRWSWHRSECIQDSCNVKQTFVRDAKVSAVLFSSLIWTPLNLAAMSDLRSGV